MKRKSLALWLSIFIILLNIMPSIAMAKEHNDVIKKVTISHENGGPIGEVYQWQAIKVNMDFELLDNEVKEGDITIIKLPEELVFYQNEGSFEIKDSNGNLVANAIVNKDTNTVTLKYTNYTENHSGVKGSLYFNVRINHVKLTEKKLVPINFIVGNKVIEGGSIDWQGPTQKDEKYLEKTVWHSDDKRILVNRIAINRKSQNIINGYIEDQLEGEGIEYIKDSVKVQKGKWKWNLSEADWDFTVNKDITDTVKINWNQDGKSFRLDFGNLTEKEGLRIIYNTKLNYDPVNGEKFINKVKLAGEKIENRDAEGAHIYRDTGGTAEGYVYSIKIIKNNENGEKLSNAKFKLVRDRNQAVIGEYISNENGEIEIKELLKDDYTLIEIEAPKGYKLDNKEIKIKTTDFDENKLLIKTIINEKESPSWTPMIPPTRNIMVSKKWLNQNGEILENPIEKIEVELYRDGVATGQKLELNSKNNWTGEFTNLIVYESIKNPTIYKYTIKEVGEHDFSIKFVNNTYNVVYEGNMKDGFTISNKEVPVIPPTPPDEPPIVPPKPPITPPDEPPIVPPKPPITPPDEPPIVPPTPPVTPPNLPPKSPVTPPVVTPPEKSKVFTPKTGDAFSILTHMGIGTILSGLVVFIEKKKKE